MTGYCGLRRNRQSQVTLARAALRVNSNYSGAKNALASLIARTSRTKEYAHAASSRPLPVGPPLDRIEGLGAKLRRQSARGADSRLRRPGHQSRARLGRLSAVG